MWIISARFKSPSRSRSKTRNKTERTTMKSSTEEERSLHLYRSISGPRHAALMPQTYSLKSIESEGKHEEIRSEGWAGRKNCYCLDSDRKRRKFPEWESVEEQRLICDKTFLKWSVVWTTLSIVENFSLILWSPCPSLKIPLIDRENDRFPLTMCDTR